MPRAISQVGERRLNSGPHAPLGEEGLFKRRPVAAARVALPFAELRLPAVEQVWADLAAQADKDG